MWPCFLWFSPPAAINDAILVQWLRRLFLSQHLLDGNQYLKSRLRQIVRHSHKLVVFGIQALSCFRLADQKSDINIGVCAALVFRVLVRA